MTDATWEIETGDDGTLTAFRLSSPQNPQIQPGNGNTEPFEFLFETRSTYETLLSYVNYPGAVSTMVSGIDRTPYYRQLRPGVDLFIGINPSGADVDSSTRGAWGVIEGGADTSNSVADDLFGIRFDIFVLAKYSDYSSRSDAKAFHET